MIPTIDSLDGLHALADALADTAVLALDTEFLRSNTYRPQLCLVQLATGATEACIDPLALGDLAPLAGILTRPAQTKVLHAASQDLEVLHQRLGVLPAPLFDTQIAAALCGLGEQIGYAALIERLFGVQLEKAHSRTDWSRRPLSREQLRYALEDVHYLPEAHAILKARLKELGRLDWLREECSAQLDPARWTLDPLEAWRRVKGWQRMPPAAFPRLRQLAAWRERRAQALDRPRRWVMDDDLLTALASRPPSKLHALLHGGMLPPGLRGAAKDIMTALEAARTDTTPPPPVWTPMRGEERARLDRLTAAIDRLAATLDLPASLLLSRAELERLARGQITLDDLRGWRAELLRAPLANAF
ncbi:MAG: ribonuclease D [Halothiobacillaceae bacterium]